MRREACPSAEKQRQSEGENWVGNNVRPANWTAAPVQTLIDSAMEKRFGMKRLAILAALCAAMTQSADAQVDLSSYADANGFIDVQKLNCAQLAGTWQGDADMLTSWYSGWYNGLARKHYLDLRKGREAEHEVIVYCKAHPEQLIIEAIAVAFKDMRAKLGIEMKP